MFCKCMKNLNTRIQYCEDFCAAARVELSVNPNADDTETQERVNIK